MILETYLDIINWWSVLFIIGLITYPITWSLFRKLYDGGYGLTKTLGTLMLSYGIFLLATLKISPFTVATGYGVLSVIGIVSLKLFITNRSNIIAFLKQNKGVILFQECLFLCGLLGWSYVRAHQPDIIGLEKFMDLGFINSLLRSKWLPPTDMWFANEPINYYWFGHFVTSVLTKLSNIPSTVTYNLMLATILGLTLTSVFSLSSTLISSIKESIKTRSIIIGALLSAILVSFAGNFHTPYYFVRQYVCTKNIVVCSPETKTGDYWYPDATRFIGYDPDVNDKTIHEFPLYSFVVSDLHAHLINLPFVLLYISFLYRYVSTTSRKKSFSLLPLMGVIIGTFFMTNAWDTANYLLLTGITLGIFMLHKSIVKNTFSLKIFLLSLKDMVIALLVICSVAYLAVSPFLRHFFSIAQGIDFVKSNTPIWQLLVLWGLPVILSTVFGIVIYSRITLKKMKSSDLFVISLLAASFVLILLPEVIYVKDIYIASHHRANTMFKLTYQAFVLSYTVSGYIALRTLSVLKSKVTQSIILVFFALVFSSLLQYPRFAINSYYSDLSIFKGLKGDVWFQNSYPDEYAVTQWFNETIKGQPTILEAQGDSYTEYNVISSYTGLPTVNGWFVHEWLWRGDASIPQERINDITSIYTSGNTILVSNLLKKYDVSYVIIGTLERRRYPGLEESVIAELGDLVFTSRQTRVYKIR